MHRTKYVAPCSVENPMASVIFASCRRVPPLPDGGIYRSNMMMLVTRCCLNQGAIIKSSLLGSLILDRSETLHWMRCLFVERLITGSLFNPAWPGVAILLRLLLLRWLPTAR
jgi:hypothetical protein